MLRRTVAVLLFATSILGLTSCTQSKIYAGDKKAGVYFTVPNGWQKVSQKQLHELQAGSKSQSTLTRLRSVIYESAYSPNPITATNVLSLNAPNSVIVYARVRGLTGDEMNAVSYNWLRDLIYPVTDSINAPASSSNFELLDDLELVQSGGRGVETVFKITGNDGISQTIDQSAIVSNDRTTIYVLLVRARSSYFEKNSQIISKLVHSFTVKGI
jgi:hypothetical protein